jgi:hypothetical protein
MLAIDIETASPEKEPTQGSHYRDTSYFELVAIALGYRDDEGDVQTTVMFREGGWEKEHTYNLIERAEHWCAERGGRKDNILTYNGERFDELHLRNWTENHETYSNRVSSLFNNHIDLSQEAQGVYRTRGRSLEELCEVAGIEVEETYFEDYQIPQVIEEKPDKDMVVSGKHFGKFLGEMYVNAVEGALRNEPPGMPVRDVLDEEHLEMRRMMKDYAEADIVPLFELYDKIQEGWDKQTTL